MECTDTLRSIFLVCHPRVMFNFRLVCRKWYKMSESLDSNLPFKDAFVRLYPCYRTRLVLDFNECTKLMLRWSVTDVNLLKEYVNHTESIHWHLSKNLIKLMIKSKDEELISYILQLTQSELKVVYSSTYIFTAERSENGSTLVPTAEGLVCRCDRVQSESFMTIVSESAKINDVSVLDRFEPGFGAFIRRFNIVELSERVKRTILDKCLEYDSPVVTRYILDGITNDGRYLLNTLKEASLRCKKRIISEYLTTHRWYMERIAITAGVIETVEYIRSL